MLEEEVFSHLEHVQNKIKNGELTPELFSRIITYHTSATRIMDGLLDGIADTDEDPRVGPSNKRYWDSEGFRYEEQAAASIIEMADALGAREILLKPYSTYERDLDFNTSFTLLVKYNGDRYHVFDYLENLLDALQDSPLSCLRKGACLNFILPSPVLKMWSPTFPSRKFDALMAGLTGTASEDAAELVVDNLIHHIAKFIKLMKTCPESKTAHSDSSPLLPRHRWVTARTFGRSSRFSVMLMLPVVLTDNEH